MQEDDYRTIDQYLQGELPAEQMTAFQQRLREEPEFAEAFTLRQQMQTYLRTQVQRPALDDALQRLNTEFFAGSSASLEAKVRTLSSTARWVLGMAATVALLLVVWNPFRTTNPYDDFAQHPPLALVERGDNAKQTEQAEAAFAQGDYPQAYSLLTNLLAETPENPQLLLGAGIAALETENYEVAADYFDQLKAVPAQSFSDYGLWYDILLSLKMGEEAQAREKLENFEPQDPSLKERVEQLRKTLF